MAEYTNEGLYGTDVREKYQLVNEERGGQIQ
jgi:hypothetical protein